LALGYGGNQVSVHYAVDGEGSRDGGSETVLFYTDEEKMREWVSSKLTKTTEIHVTFDASTPL
jgi:hypothetical protein